MTLLTPYRPVGMAIALLTLCAPLAAAQKPSHTPPAHSKIDPLAMALLEKVEKRMLSLKTYQAECLTRTYFPASNGRRAFGVYEYARLFAAKPNRMRYDQWYLDRNARPDQRIRINNELYITFVGDGKTNWKQFGRTYRIDKRTKPKQMRTINEPWGGFYSASGSPHGYMTGFQRSGELLEVHLSGRQPVNGIRCDKIFAHIKLRFMGHGQEYWETWYVDRGGLVRRRLKRIDLDGKPSYTENAVIRHIRINAPIPASVLTYKPPKGVRTLRTEKKDRPAPPEV